jgi:MoxR-like ATPase
MQEQQATIDIETIPLPRPFLVIATQNPVELEGTFPLPEAQLDRFLLKIKLGYPSKEEEANVLLRFQQTNPLGELASTIEKTELLELQKLCRQVYVEDSLRDYIVAITRATRNHKNIELGASPRSSLVLQSASQALAAVRGRNYVIPDDIKALSVPVLSHRLVAKTKAQLQGHDPGDIIREVISCVTVPVEERT